MKQSIAGLAALVAVVIATSPLFAVADDANTGFTPLFNGTDLSGWKGDTRLWTVSNGEIVGSTEGIKLEHNSFLISEKKYSDFVLKVKVKLRNHNSGVQFRSKELDDFAVSGYQADVAEKTYFGMLYEEQGRGILEYWNKLPETERAAIHAAGKQGDWNEYEITCQGDHVKMVLNGKVTLDFDDPAGAKDGIIALQLHAGPSMQVFFKDISIKELPKKTAGALDDGTELLMPDYDRTRTARLGVEGRKFMIPDGFAIDELATNELIGSVVNMTFDHQGRPVMCAQEGGINILVDENSDGTFDKQIVFTDKVKTCHGIYYLGPGDVLVHGNGPDGAGLYRVTDTNGDDQADDVKTIAQADGSIGEHGPHAIAQGPDGYIYTMYGNHASPDEKLAKLSPVRDLQEDFVLPPYYDPRGHATHIRAPGGGIYRITPDLAKWDLVVGGFRNAFDFGMNAMGELFTFDSDMEWDVGEPWYRPIRIAHCIPGADYGWRTGSYNPPFYYIDSLPSVDDIGRGSPVGVCFYYHYAFPEKFFGAFFTADWSRGRIRVNFPQDNGATYKGRAVDFVVGEPLNVTDVDVGPDGALYFTTGGRSTNGGFYRVRYTGEPWKTPGAGIDGVLEQPMPRSAWGKVAIQKVKDELGDAWGDQIRAAASNTAIAGDKRANAIEVMQIYGPKPELSQLEKLVKDPDPKVRAAAVFLIGTHPFRQVRQTLSKAISDSDPLVRRRVCEALVRSGITEGKRMNPGDPIVRGLLDSLNHPDRFVRYAARLAIMRVYRGVWESQVTAWKMEEKPNGALQGLLALILTEESAPESDRIFTQLDRMSQSPLEGEVLLDYLRVMGLAFVRDVTEDDRAGIKQKIGPVLLAKFPSADARIHRELQVALAYLNPPGAIPALLAQLTPDKSQEEQIHTIYCLRAIKDGWTKEERTQLVAWFDRGRTMGGGASFEGYITNLWDSTMELLPEDEKQVAQAHMKDLLDKRAADALALLAQIEGEKTEGTGELAQMGFQELSEFLEYDPMAYNTKEETLQKGKKTFIKARCVNCHVFGDLGKGGGPDLSTVVSRFRRRDILEAIMYPSKVVSDQYQAYEVELDDFTSQTGMLASEDATTLSLINTNGERVDIPKAKITKQTVSHNSIMPEGLLATMGMGDLSALINFLEQGPDSVKTAAAAPDSK
jgi:putative heme-binding domain-containing protein